MQVYIHNENFHTVWNRSVSSDVIPEELSIGGDGVQ